MGEYGDLFNGSEDFLKKSDFIVFEMDHLIQKGGKASLLALLYLFHMIQKRLDGAPSSTVINKF
jgi:type IV secretion system protein VirB4